MDHELKESIDRMTLREMQNLLMFHPMYDRRLQGAARSYFRKRLEELQRKKA